MCNAKKCQDKKIRWRLGAGLFGPAGTGKTSTKDAVLLPKKEISNVLDRAQELCIYLHDDCHMRELRDILNDLNKAMVKLGNEIGDSASFRDLVDAEREIKF